MRLVFAGYFPKRFAPRPAWLHVPHVKSIGSVSECLSAGPEGWIRHGGHNALGLYDTFDMARSVVPADGAGFEVLGYRVLDVLVDGEHARALDLGASRAVEPPAAVSLGYDAVSWTPGGLPFGCSPLSCNGGAAELPVNELCLFPSLEDAVQGARLFGAGHWEPGPYAVVEALRRNGRSARS